MSRQRSAPNFLFPRARTWATTLACLAAQAACFGTGVSLDRIARQDLAPLEVNNATLIPPAPASEALLWANTNVAPMVITALEVDEAAQIVWDTTLCPDYPTLKGSSSCAVGAIAQESATPGAYPVTVRYALAGQTLETQFVLTIEPGQLRINSGAPIPLDATSSAVPVRVLNEGFDLNALNLQVQCPPASGSTEACVLNLNDCRDGLRANASCTALLTTTRAVAGSTGTVTAGGPGTAAVACSTPLSVGGVTAETLRITAPGRQALKLTNAGGTPVSVQRVSAADPRTQGIVAVGLGDRPTACQNFVGTCYLALDVSVDADVPGGVGALMITYTAANATHTLSSSLLLDNATSVQVDAHPGKAASGLGTLEVSATNLGPFTWHQAGLKLDPTVAGLSLYSTCSTELAPGEPYTATVRSTQAVVEGAATALKAQGTNLRAAASRPLDVGYSLAVVGLDAAANGNAYLGTSYDGGTSWTMRARGLTQAAWHGVLIDGDTWTTVGTQAGAPLAATSRDRGATWATASAQSGPGALNAVAGEGGHYMAVGAGPANTPVYRVSTDAGATWDAAITPAAFGAGPATAVANAGQIWVVTGGDGASYWMAISVDDTATWSSGPTGPGSLHGVATDGQAWLAVGDDGAGHMLMLVTSGAIPAPVAWSAVPQVAAWSGALRSVSSNGARWLAVGDQGGQRLALLGDTPNQATFSAPQLLGPGRAHSVVWHDGAWVVAGEQSATTTGVIDRSVDGTTWSGVLMPHAVSLLGAASRFN